MTFVKAKRLSAVFGIIALCTLAPASPAWAIPEACELAAMRYCVSVFPNNAAARSQCIIEQKEWNCSGIQPPSGGGGDGCFLWTGQGGPVWVNC